MIEENLGAIEQTRAELSVYHWPGVPIQDALRQSRGVDLTAALKHYATAVMLDSSNAAAARRWAQVELARGEYRSACRHLELAYAAHSEQRATRQLLGECFALNDQVDQAIALWRSIDMSEGQLTIRMWWYRSYLGELERAAHLDRAVQALDSS
jgi:tetratricopeptide (TPR) repeat protein